MISSIRKYIKGRGFKVVLWIGVFSFLLPIAGMSIIPAIVRLFKKRELTGVASVNGTEVSLMEFQRSYFPIVQFIKEAKKQYGEQADLILSIWGIDSSKKPEEFVLNKLIQEKTTQNAAEKLNAQISQEYINRKLHDPVFVRDYLGNIVPPQAIQNGQIDGSILSAYLERIGVSGDEFNKIVHQIIERELLFNLITGSSYASLDDLKQEYMRLYSKRKYAIASFDLKVFEELARKSKLSDEDIAKFFNENKNNYIVPEKRSGKLWTFTEKEYGVVVSDKDISSYYDKHKSDFIVSPGQRKIKRILIEVDKDTDEAIANKKAQELLEQVRLNPESFDKLAKEEISVVRGEKDPAFEQAVFSINSPGEVSSVVKTQKGFEIIKLVDIVAAKYKELKEVKDEILKKIKVEKFEKEFNSSAKRIICQSSDVPAVFDNYIKSKNAKVSDVSSASKSDSQESQKLFALGKIGDKAFYYSDDTGYIVELSNIEKSYMPKLDDVKNKVVENLYLHNAKKELQNTVDKINLVGAKEFESAVKKAKGSLDDTGLIDPEDPKSFKALSDKKIPTKEVFALINVGAKVKHVGPENAYVIELKEISKFDEKDFEKNKQEIKQQLYKLNAQETVQGYIKSLEHDAKIEINKDLLKQVVARG